MKRINASESEMKNEAEARKKIPLLVAREREKIPKQARYNCRLQSPAIM